MMEGETCQRCWTGTLDADGGCAVCKVLDAPIDAITGRNLVRELDRTLAWAIPATVALVVFMVVAALICR